MPKVSIVVPSYNHARFLDQRLNSILEQDYRDFDLLILDDFSTDGSREIIRRYQLDFPQITTHFNATNSGNPFRQWDMGVQMTGGEYIWIAESDDYAHPCFLSEAVPVLEENPKVGMVFARSRRIDEFGRNTGFYGSYRPCAHNYITDGIGEIERHMCSANKINNVSGVLFRRSAYVQTGIGDHWMRFCGDWFLYIRMLMISDVAHIPTPLNYLRYHAGSSVHAYFRDTRYLEEVLSIYEFLEANVGLSSDMRRRISHQWVRLTARALSRGLLSSMRLLRRASRMDPRFGRNALAALAVEAKGFFAPSPKQP